MNTYNLTKVLFIAFVCQLASVFVAKAQIVDITAQSGVYNLSPYPNYDPGGSVTGTFTVQVAKDVNSYAVGDFTINVTLPSASPIIGTGIIVPAGFQIISGGTANATNVVFGPSLPWTGSLPADITRIFVIPVKIIAAATQQPAQTSIQWLNPLVTENPSGNVVNSFLNVTNIPLPVSLLDFKATKLDNASQLTWKTAYEKNNLGFDIERSADGKTFTKIGYQKSIAQNGNSEGLLDYLFTDNRPLSGINYYRLKQMDIDGKLTYTNVVNVVFGKVQGIKLYPNPASQIINVEATAVTRIELYNIIGQQVKVPVTYGADNNTINTSGLSDGNYTIRVLSGEEVNAYKIVVKK